MILNRPIAISLSPNTELDDFIEAIKILFSPFLWQKGNSINKVHDWFQKYFQVENVYSFNSGRSALMAILFSFGIGKGDEVIVQSFSCVAVADPVIWMGAKPVFIDIDNSLNADPVEFEKHITSKTKAIIVQHTFGIPGDIERIKNIAYKKRIIIIEDCAHSLGAKINNKKVGLFGDASFFSFGRDKIISSVFGGLALINEKHKKENIIIKDYWNKLNYPTNFWIIRQILHPIIFSLILPIYNIYLGKILMVILQKIHILSFPVDSQEKNGQKPEIFPAKYPNALATILLLQLAKLERYNNKRKEIAEYYFQNLKKIKNIELPIRKQGSIYLRFNILTKESSLLFLQAKKKGIILGNWYKATIDPKGVNYNAIGYVCGECSKAEEYARLSVNLPTYPRLTKSDLDKIIFLIKYAFL